MQSSSGLHGLISAKMADPESVHKVTIYRPPGRMWNVADDSGLYTKDDTGLGLKYL